MSVEKQKLAKLANTKRALAEKYMNLAAVAKSKPKQRQYAYRAERYARQAELKAQQSE